MAKKKDEKDVLVVRDEKTGEISVVAGLNAPPWHDPKIKAKLSCSYSSFKAQGVA